MAHVTYLPAEYCENSRSYVQFYCLRPETDKMERYRYYFDRVKDRSHRKRQAMAFVREINDKLIKGWAPWHESTAPNLGAKLSDMVALFLGIKERTLRPRSLPNYKSRMNKLLLFVAKKKLKDCTCHQFSTKLASDFMDTLIHEGMAGRTYNNYLMDMKGLGNWGVQRGYWAANPWHTIKPLRQGDPEKRPLTDDEMAKMLGHIEQEQPNFLIVCGLVYYCAIRPEEISHLKVHQIDGKQGMIRVTSAGTKDHEGRWITIPAQFVAPLLHHIDGALSSDYVVSTGFVPGQKHIRPLRYAEAWKKHRDAMKLSIDVKLYGLKHTALRALAANGVDTVTIRDHARHSNLAITDAYMKSLRGFVQTDVRSKYPSMG